MRVPQFRHAFCADKGASGIVQPHPNPSPPTNSTESAQHPPRSLLQRYVAHLPGFHSPITTLRARTCSSMSGHSKGTIAPPKRSQWVQDRLTKGRFPTPRCGLAGNLGSSIGSFPGIPYVYMSDKCHPCSIYKYCIVVLLPLLPPSLRYLRWGAHCRLKLPKLSRGPPGWVIIGGVAAITLGGFYIHRQETEERL